MDDSADKSRGSRVRFRARSGVERLGRRRRRLRRELVVMVVYYRIPVVLDLAAQTLVVRS